MKNEIFFLSSIVAITMFGCSQPLKAHEHKTPIYFETDLEIHSFLRGKTDLDGDVPFTGRVGFRADVKDDFKIGFGLAHDSNVDRSGEERNNETIYLNFQYQLCLINC